MPSHSFSPISSKISSRRANLSGLNKKKLYWVPNHAIATADCAAAYCLGGKNFLRCKLCCFSFNSPFKCSNISTLFALVAHLQMIEHKGTLGISSSPINSRHDGVCQYNHLGLLWRLFTLCSPPGVVLCFYCFLDSDV